MIKIEALKVGLLSANCYIVYDQETLEGMVIDPGGNPEIILEYVKNFELNITRILLTHGHGDHIAGVEGVAKALKVPVWVHKNDKELMEDGTKNLSVMLHIGDITYDADVYFDESSSMEFLGQQVKIIHTPGHTPGSVSFLIGSDLFVGDTLFFHSIGRSDLYAGNFDDLEKSIQEKIYTLDESIKIYPGHGPQTNVGEEMKNNSYIKKRA